MKQAPLQLLTRYIIMTISRYQLLQGNNISYITLWVLAIMV